MKRYLRKRRVVAATILATGLLVAFLLVFSSPEEKKPLISIVGNTNNNTGSNYETGKNRGLFNLDPLSSSTDGTATQNMTQALAQNYMQTVYDLNGQNPTDASGTLRMPPSNSVNNALQQALSQNLAFPSFAEKDIRVGKDDSLQAQINYMNAIGSITQKNFKGFTMQTTDILSALLEKNDSGPLAKYINIIDGEINDLLALEAPPRWATWHLQNLNLWEKKSVAYTAILDFNNDPLKATIALNDVRSILQENTTLQKTISDRFNALNQEK